MLSDGLDDAGKRALESIAARREGTEVAFYEPSRLLSAETLESIGATLSANKTHVTKETYYRILAADLLPADAHRALYLDGDVLCTGGLEELFGIDMKGCPCGMCLSAGALSFTSYNRLGYPMSEKYFGAGIVLLDIGLWRKENLTAAMLGYLEENAKKLLWHDQDLINACLHGRIFQLDYSCVISTSYLHVFHWLREENGACSAGAAQFLPKDEWPALLAGVESPRLVHFIGPVKPWHKECENPFTPVWRCFYAQSPWAGERLKSYVARLPLKRRLRWLGRRALERLDLVSPPIPYPEEAYKVAQRVLDEAKRGFSDSAAQ